MTRELNKATYSSGEAATLLQVPARTLRRYLTIGRIRGKQNPITGTWTIEREDLLAFMKRFHLDTEALVAPTRVLVVDDEVLVSDFVLKTLTRLHPDWQAEACNNGYEALLKIGSFAPKLLILDIHMPGTDGREVLKIVKSKPETCAIKVLVISGYPSDFEGMLRLGADDTLVKPFAPEALLAKVEAWFPKSSANTAAAPPSQHGESLP